MSEPANNYLSNSLWMLLEKSSRIISGILVGVLVARYLGPSQFGLISYALSVIAIFTILSTLGMDSIVVRELITRKEKSAEILGTSFYLRLSGALLVILFSAIYSFLRDTPERTMTILIVSGSIAIQAFSVLDFYFQSQLKGKYTAMAQVFTLLASSVIKLVLIWLDASVYWFAFMAVFEAGMSASLQFRYYKMVSAAVGKWKFSLAEAKLLLQNSYPIIGSSLVLMIYQKSGDILVLRFLRDLGMVGQYAAAVRISEASYFIPVAICAAVFPGIVNNRNNPELQLKRYIQLCSIMIWSAIAVSIGGLILGDWAITFLYKDGYPLSPGIFKLHIWGSIPVYFGTAWGMWMLAQHRQKVIIFFQIFNLIAYLFTSFYFIPKFQVTGMAYAVLVTYYLGLLATLLFYKPGESIGVFIKALNPAHLLDVFRYSKAQRTKK
ncbi:MAG: flippase [Bacteroidetes bacterium]|nr:flippase [Bacteroidota bacterium]